MVKAKEIQGNRRLAYQGLKSLNHMRAKGESVQRDVAKKEGTDHEIIFADKTYKELENNWLLFCEWLDNNGYKVRTLGKVKSEVIIAYLSDIALNGGRDGQGASKATLQARLGAINKLLVGTGRVSEADKLTITKLIKADKVELRNDIKSKVGYYKDTTSDEWIKENQKKYESYKQLIDTMRAFGIRSREVEELNRSSFLVDNKGDMYVQVIGKGSKYRIAKCRNELRDDMLAYYGQNSTKIDDLSSFKGNKDYLLRSIAKESQRLKIKGYKSHKLPKHIFRSEYAREMLKELNESYKGQNTTYKGYSVINKHHETLEDYEIQINATKGNAQAFMEVSEQLGHNRLDVLKKYL